MSDTEQQEQALSAWPFAQSYQQTYSNLPASQLREAMKRLTERKRNPLSIEKLTDEDPEIEGVLSGIRKAYMAKKERAKLASATKRASQREAAQTPVNVVAEVEAAEDLTVTSLSLEPAEVVATEPEPVKPEPESEPEQPNLPGSSGGVGVPPQVKPPASKPVAIPLARQHSQTPVARPKKVSGLRGKFA
jgi:hypothetical protein